MKSARGHKEKPISWSDLIHHELIGQKQHPLADINVTISARGAGYQHIRFARVPEIASGLDVRVR